VERAQNAPASTVRQVGLAYVSAIGQGDFERARRYLSDQNFLFRGPYEAIEGADRFVARYWGAGQITLELHVRRVFEDGNELCIIFDIETQLSERATTPVAMWLRVEGHRIVEMETFHDARGYAELFDAG
jgi:hypothetical protein